MGPCPVPPVETGSSTVSRKPPASTEHSHSPCQVATAVFVPSRSADSPSVDVPVPVVVPVVVAHRPAGVGHRPLGHLVRPQQPRPGEDLLQRLQPAAVVAEA